MLFPPGITVVLTVFCGGDGARSGRSGREAGGTAITTWAAGPPDGPTTGSPERGPRVGVQLALKTVVTG